MAVVGAGVAVAEFSGVVIPHAIQLVGTDNRSDLAARENFFANNERRARLVFHRSGAVEAWIFARSSTGQLFNFESAGFLAAGALFACDPLRNSKAAADAPNLHPALVLHALYLAAIDLHAVEEGH
ncbi:hypothetical protein D9M72_617430 [compost metagenome]